MSPHRSRPGYLLVEMLAVITLLGIAFAAVLPALAPRSEAIEQTELVDRLVSFDEQARIAALREGPLLLLAEPEAGTLTLGSTASEDIIKRLVVPRSDITLISTATGRPVRGIEIDRLGRSEPYQLLLRPSTGESIRLEFNRYGLRTNEAKP